MKQTVLARTMAIEKVVKSKATWPTCDCLMTDGTRQRLFGMMIVQPFLNGEVAELVTNDNDLAALLRAMDTDETIKIDVKEL